MSGLVQRAHRRVGGVGVEHQRHADAAVEDPVHLVRRDRPQALDLPEHPRLLPGRPLQCGAQAAGQGAREVAHNAAARDVGAGVQRIAERAAHGEHGGGVDHRRAQQLVRHAVVGTRPGGVAELEAGPFEQDVAGERVAVRAQTRRGQPHDDVARPHALGAELGPLLHHADGEAGQVELVARHDAGVLGRLAADERAPRLAAALVHPRHHGGHLVGVQEMRTILVTVAASLLAGLLAHVADRLLGLGKWTADGGGAGSLLRLLVLATIMLPIMAVVMVRAQVPEAQAAVRAVRRRITGQRDALLLPKPTLPSHTAVTYPEQRNSSQPVVNAVQEPIRRKPPERAATARIAKGLEVTDRPRESAASSSASGAELPRPAADDFQPDIPADVESGPPSKPRPPEDVNGDFPGEAGRGLTPLDAPLERGGESSAHPDDVHLVPGARIASGRYRLLVFHGSAPPLQFWQALDTALDRQVALTFVDPDGSLPADVLQEILSRTLRLSRIDKPGIARVLDVIRTGSGGLVVSEWIRGGSLQEVADTSPSPVGAVRAMQSLAAAADAAHRAGVALSIDHPSRVRVSIDGDVVLAYPATMPDANPQDDIRGIGAALYALLVNRWPLREFGVRSGLAPAKRDAAGLPIEPTVIDRDIPFQISAVAVRAVQEDGGIRSASTLLNLLQQATAVADRTEVLGPIEELPPPATSRQPAARNSGAFADRRRNLVIGTTAAAAIIVVALLVLASVVKGIFGNLGGGLNNDKLGLNTPTSSTSSGEVSSAPAGSVVKPTKATVFSPDGDADNPGQAGLAIDGDPATSWQTDVYTDAVPFPSFKKGEGLMLQLPNPTVVGAVTVDTPSTGTKVEIRSASSPSPATLEDTKVLTPATALKPGHNVIKVSTSTSTSNLLVWISTLGTTDGKSRAEISEITVQAAS